MTKHIPTAATVEKAPNATATAPGATKESEGCRVRELTEGQIEAIVGGYEPLMSAAQEHKLYGNRGVW